MKIMVSIQNSFKYLKDVPFKIDQISEKADLLNTIENKINKAIQKVKEKRNKCESDLLLLTTITSPKDDDNQLSLSQIQGLLDAGTGITPDELLSNFTSADNVVDDFNKHLTLQQQWDNGKNQSYQSYQYFSDAETIPDKISLDFTNTRNDADDFNKQLALQQQWDNRNKQSSQYFLDADSIP